MGWLGKAEDQMEKKGTKGAFSAAAKKADMSTAAFARKEIASPKASGLMKKRATFALNAIGVRARKHRDE